jgi:hypothetical protein
MGQNKLVLPPEPTEGFEPTTHRLRSDCSTTELRRRLFTLLSTRELSYIAMGDPYHGSDLGKWALKSGSLGTAGEDSLRDCWSNRRLHGQQLSEPFLLLDYVCPNRI